MFRMSRCLIGSWRTGFSVKRGPNNIDVNVGARVRTRRLAVGLTQDKLAKAVGITFQQIQKYEKGVNRIGAGRLKDISRALGTSVGFFYADLPEAVNEQSREPLREGKRPTSKPAVVSDPSSDGLVLIKSFLKIDDPEVRRHLLALVDALSRRCAG